MTLPVLFVRLTPDLDAALDRETARRREGAPRLPKAAVVRDLLTGALRDALRGREAAE